MHATAINDIKTKASMTAWLASVPPVPPWPVPVPAWPASAPAAAGADAWRGAVWLPGPDEERAADSTPAGGTPK
jgi:hypothetical protein